MSKPRAFCKPRTLKHQPEALFPSPTKTRLSPRTLRTTRCTVVELARLGLHSPFLSRVSVSVWAFVVIEVQSEGSAWLSGSSSGDWVKFVGSCARRSPHAPVSPEPLLNNPLKQRVWVCLCFGLRVLKQSSSHQARPALRKGRPLSDGS